MCKVICDDVSMLKWNSFKPHTYSIFYFVNHGDLMIWAILYVLFFQVAYASMQYSLLRVAGLWD